jgi:hypothetical protein
MRKNTSMDILYEFIPQTPRQKKDGVDRPFRQRSRYSSEGDTGPPSTRLFLEPAEEGVMPELGHAIASPARSTGKHFARRIQQLKGAYFSEGGAEHALPIVGASQDARSSLEEASGMHEPPSTDN